MKSIVAFLLVYTFLGVVHARSLSEVCPQLNSSVVSPLLERGFSKTVAERIACLRPDIAALIAAPDIQIVYAVSPKILPDGVTIGGPYTQSRNAKKLYRGITIGLDKYDPRFRDFWAATQKDIMFVTENALFASGFADNSGRGEVNGEGKPGIVIEYEFPEFLVLPYNTLKNDMGPVIYRGAVPDDTPFISRVAVIAQSADRNAINYSDRQRVLDDSFKSFDEVLPLMPLVTFKREVRFAPDGKLLPRKN